MYLLWQTTPKPSESLPYSPKNYWHFLPSLSAQYQLFDKWFPHDQQPHSPTPPPLSEHPPIVENPYKWSHNSTDAWWGFSRMFGACLILVVISLWSLCDSNHSFFVFLAVLLLVFLWLFCSMFKHDFDISLLSLCFSHLLSTPQISPIKCVSLEVNKVPALLWWNHR